MAERARDLTLNLVTDQSQFDTDQAARGLGDVADAAGQAASGQADLSRDADRAAGDLERMAQAALDADRAARGLGDASTAAGDSTRTAADEADEASGAFGDFRDEAASNLMEVAGSFDGTMQGIVDGVQGALPALGAAFGGLGLAVGSAAAVGIGLFKAQAEKLKEQVSSLTSSLIADGGRLSRESVLGKLEELAADGTLTDLAEQARRARVPVGDFLLAAAGDPAALERSRRALEYQADAVYDLSSAQAELGQFDREGAGAREERRQAIEDATGALEGNAKATELAGQAVAAYDVAVAASGPATEEAAEAQAAYQSAMEGVSAEAADMAAAVEEGVDAVIAAQERQLQAAADLEKNTGIVLDRLGADAVQWALDQGDSADEAMQLLADAPVEKGQAIVTNYRTLNNRIASQTAAAFAAQGTAVESAARELVRRAQVGLDSRPLTVRTKLDPTGYDSGLRTLVRYGRVAV